MTPTERATPAIDQRPEPHSCPWWAQYMLISPIRRILEPARSLLGSHVKADMTVLEPGCGFGYVTLALAREVGPGGRVIALDIEPGAIERLQRRARRAGLADRVEARVCQPRDLGVAAYSGQVDLVAVVHTLHEFEDLSGFLTQCAALLKPDGRLLVVEPRGHVKPKHFAAELAYCHQRGFRDVHPPDDSRRRMTALLTPRTSG